MEYNQAHMLTQTDIEQIYTTEGQNSIVEVGKDIESHIQISPLLVLCLVAATTVLAAGGYYFKNMDKFVSPLNQNYQRLRIVGCQFMLDKKSGRVFARIEDGFRLMYSEEYQPHASKVFKGRVRNLHNRSEFVLDTLREFKARLPNHSFYHEQDQNNPSYYSITNGYLTYYYIRIPQDFTLLNGQIVRKYSVYIITPEQVKPQTNQD